MKNLYIIGVGILLLVTSCKGVDKLYADGKDEKVIEKVINREKKHLATVQEVRIAEKAYHRLQDKLMADLTQLNQLADEEKWSRIFDVANQIEQLQRTVEIHSPIIAKNGYVAEFKLVNVQDLKEKSGKKAGEFFEKRGNERLTVANTLTQPYQKARDAYYDFENAERYDNSLDLSWEKEEAEDLGIIKITTQVGNEVNFRGFRVFGSGYQNDVERELERMVDFRNSKWIEKTYSSAIATDADFLVTVSLRDIDISNVRERRENTNHSKQIQENARNANGTIIRDSLGNAIQTYRTINAVVRKTVYEKEAEVEVEVSIVNLKTGERNYRRTYNEDETYREETCEIIGDENAVSNAGTCRNSTYTFMQEEEMIEELLEDMRNQVNRDIERQINQLD